MSYCMKCGSEIPEGEQSCKICGESQIGVSLSKGEPEEQQTGQTETVKRNEPVKPQPPTHPVEPESKGISNMLKVFLAAVTVAVPILGPVLGIIMSLIYLSSPHMDSRSYGKALLIMTVVYIGICVICCLGFMFLSMAGYVADMEYYYQQQFDIY